MRSAPFVCAKLLLSKDMPTTQSLNSRQSIGQVSTAVSTSLSHPDKPVQYDALFLSHSQSQLQTNTTRTHPLTHKRSGRAVTNTYDMKMNRTFVTKQSSITIEINILIVIEMRVQRLHYYFTPPTPIFLSLQCWWHYCSKPSLYASFLSTVVSPN